MAEKSKESAQKERVVPRSISSEMKEAYLDYAMSVITARALPDVRDGLKPVHRRILFSMRQNNLTASAKFRKSATVVGDVIGNYHPHGDAAVYDALVKMAQDFNYRYPLVLGQGNFGSLDGDPPAAYRYTESKMSRLSEELLRDLEKETVEFRPNFDGSKKEPVVLPSAVPNLLLNGTLGIAVGMATNIPSHNLREVCEAVIHLVDTPDATTDDLLSFVKGPDFPTGGIIYNQKDIRHAYSTGRGGVVTRGVTEIVENKKGNFDIIASSIPYRVNKADLLMKIAQLVRDKKIEGVKDLRDESSKGEVRVVVELKGGAQPQKVLNYIYKHTQLEDTFHFNTVALVDGVPQTLSLKGILEEFIKHRRIVVKRRTQFDLTKAEEREHILIGLKKALDQIDAIIKTIKASKDTKGAHANLMKQFKLSDRQSTAILEMRLQKLAGLERKRVEDELADIQKLIKELKTILASDKKMLGIIKDELSMLSEKFGDDRRTKVVKSGVKTLSDEDLVPEEESVLVLTAGGYIKRINPSEFKKQKRGGVGVVDLNTKEEDFVTRFLTASTHSDILFFTDRGKVYQLKMHEIPEGRRATKGKSIMNFLSLSSEERVTSALALPKELKKGDLSLLMVTKDGIAKKVAAESFYDVRRSGLIAIKLKEKDELISTQFVASGDQVALTTSSGQGIRFKELEIREMGRAASGVKAIKLSSGDGVIGASILAKGSRGAELLVLSEKGYGKKTKLAEYKVQHRGGTGIKTANVTQKTGSLIASRVVGGEVSTEGSVVEEGELVVISKKGQVIRVDLAEIPSLGRQTQGVRIMKLRTGDSIASLICL